MVLSEGTPGPDVRQPVKVIQTSGVVLWLMTAACATPGQRPAKDIHAPAMRVVTVQARPWPLALDLRKTAVIVVDMQNDLVTKGGLIDRLGLDVASIQKIVPPMREFLELARTAGLTIVYLKMGYRADLSDVGSEDSPMGTENRRTHVGPLS